MEKSIVKKENTENGMMVVEAVLSFTAFIMVVVAVIYLINIFMLHNKIQFAINSAAHEIASYSYLYAALGLNDMENTMGADGNPHTTPINDTVNQVVDSLNKIETLSATLGGTMQSVENLELNGASMENVKSQLDRLRTDAEATADSVEGSMAGLSDLFSHPRSMLIGMIYIGAYELRYEAKSMIGTKAAEGFTKKYLEQGNMSADEYLRAYGVEEGYSGLDFSGTTIFCENGDGAGRIIDIVVSYDIDMSFLDYIMPESKVHVVQRVSVAGWVDGDGEKLIEYGITKM